MRLPFVRKSGLPSYKKSCPRCARVMKSDATRCPSCGCSPWKWHVKPAYLIISLVIAVFLFILVPMLTTGNSQRPIQQPASTP